ncbi:unnamed protein product [Caenorhabditis auriculariae]|uniref:Uncharacterized protein n=1 Tax=Caenorhabditis auriculariae TaxID=2777116 RepID=A0A8S1H176_9PELO|nr:unnamed protein product [Caenorhabditis auriculariae]
MIPEFPLPPVDADFYRSQIANLPPLFGVVVQTPIYAEPTTFLTRIQNPIDLCRPLRIAAVQPAKYRVPATASTISSRLQHHNRSSLTSPNLGRNLVDVARHVFNTL